MNSEIRLIPGATAVDDRGRVRFCNEFDFAGVKRFYVVSNHEPRFTRAWHGHEKEGKYAFVASGAALFAVVRVEDWDAPDRQAPIERLVLSEDKPGVLAIPGGHAHGFMTLAPHTRIFFFSTASLEESGEDDYRFPHDTWNPWDVLPR